MKGQIICESCERQPARYIRRTSRRGDGKSNFVMKKDKGHSLCLRCASAMFESYRQSAVTAHGYNLRKGGRSTGND